MVPMVPLLAKAIVYVLQNEVPPYGGLSDLGRFIADCAGKPFYLYMAIGALIATIWLPLGGAVTYLKRYKLFGLPHAIVDYGTGMYVVSTYLLSSYHGDVRWYWAIAPAVVILRIIQIGGYIPEERNSQAAVVGKTAEK